MKQILINGSFLAQPRTGVQRFALEISKALRAIQPDILIAVPKNTMKSEIWQDLAPITIGRFSGHLWEQIDLPLYAWQQKALLLNLDMRGPLAYPNKMITIHDLNFLHNPAWVTPKFYYFYKLLVSAGAKTSRKICTVSQFSKYEITRFLQTDPEKIAVIYNAVSDRIKNIHTVAEKVISSDYILSVASTDPRKNLSCLIEAFHQISNQNIKLVLVGLSHKKNALSISNENIIFLGHIDDKTLVNLYRHARLFVYPSLYEGFGIPPLEAMYHGCPVVTSHTTSLPEICGDAAWYVDPESATSIAEGIQYLLTDTAKRNELIMKGKQQVKRFDWNQSAEKLLSIIKTMNDKY